MSAKFWPIIGLGLQSEVDIVLARQRARQVASLLGADSLQQVRIATAVSEIARNAIVHAGGGRVELLLEDAAPRSRLLVRVTDRGGGMVTDDDPSAHHPILGRRGAGMPIARRLADSFTIESSTSGTTVTLGFTLPAGVQASAAEAVQVADALVRRPPESLMEELHLQNQELLRVLDNLMTRQDELLRLNEELEETNRGVLALHEALTRELEETNRGVVALYGELDDRTEELRRSNNVKDQFISYLSHEFRTPVHSIIALSHILLESPAAPLQSEQQKQVGLVLKSSSALLELVDDLLDLAKISAGRLTVHPEAFTVADLFGALRGMMRPLVPSDGSVSLVFSDPVNIPPLYADQGKLSQILRNLTSNALKFTSEGEVHVSARLDGEDAVVFTVADTGIGIAPHDQQRIFSDYEQVHGAFQRRAKGTGLGLPLSQRLAELLGGRITLESKPGVGSTFRVHLPLRFAGDTAGPVAREGPVGVSSGEAHILIVDDDAAARYVLRHLLESLGCTVSEAANGEDALRIARDRRPGAMFVDLVMPGLDGYELIQRLRADPQTTSIPVIIRTGKQLSDDERARLVSRAAEILTKDEDGTDRERAALRVGAALARVGIQTRQHSAT
ncbi:MAG TPA: ATP-binding protein [Longimicrobiales bacterium]